MKKLTSAIIVFLILGLASSSLSEEKTVVKVTGNFYYDIATGHKYIKNPGTDTYREYSQKGKLLRDAVPNNLPLLVMKKYIREMKRDHYLLYQKINYQRKELMVLSPEQDHPNGWVCKKLLVTIK